MSPTLRIEHDGAGLHVEVDGPDNAVAVVFLHGVTSSAEAWRWLPEELTRGRRIVRIDLRGHGRSGHTPGRYTLLEYGGDVVQILREIGGVPAVLVGHSLGGVVSWWIAQNHPDLVTAAFLEDPPLLAFEAPPERTARAIELFKMLLANIRSYRNARLSEKEIAQRIGDAPSGPPALSLPPLRDMVMADALNAMAFGQSHLDVGVIESVIDGSTLAATDVTSPMKKPILILAADDALGAAFSTEEEKQLAKTHPAVEVIRIAGSAHGIHNERRYRETFVHHLRRFLDRYAPSAG